MQHISLERDGRVLVATMSRGKANALNEALVGELRQVVADAEADDRIGALVIASASPRLFSGGFDLAEVFAYDDDRMRAFFGRFVDMLEALRALPKGVVAAVAGHAYAGGALIALACDFRILGDSEVGFAVNEIDLGIVLPAEGTRWMAPALGGAMREVLLGGAPLGPERALAIGLAKALAPAERVRQDAVAYARTLAEKPPRAFAAVKRGIVESTGGLMDATARRTFIDEFMRFWTGDESRARRAALVESMKR